MNKNNIKIKIFRFGCENSETVLRKGTSIKELRKIKKVINSIRIFKETKGGILEVNDDYLLINQDRLFLVNKMSGAATVKGLGRVWSIHYTDKDIFPSDFHAHDENNGDKLDLYTGEKYNKFRKFIKTIRKKQLIDFLKELSRIGCYKGKTVEVLKLISNEKD